MPSYQIYGKHPVFEVLKAGTRKVEKILYAHENEKNIQDILNIARKKNVRLESCSKKELSKKTEDANHQGLLAFVAPPKIFSLQDFIRRVTNSDGNCVVAVMDSITDPHNFGAILRSAESFGVKGAIFPKDRSCDINSTVVKTSAGASEHLEFSRITNIANGLKALKQSGFHIIAAEADGDIELPKFNPLFPLAVVLGSEGKGIRPLVKKQCDDIVRIPTGGKVGSLNVSASAALVFYEIFKSH